MKHMQCLLALLLAAGPLGGCNIEDNSEAKNKKDDSETKDSITPPTTAGTLAVTFSDAVALGLIEGGIPQAQVDSAKSKVDTKLGAGTSSDAAGMGLQDPVASAFDQNDPVATIKTVSQYYSEAMSAEGGVEYVLFLQLLTNKSFAFINTNLADQDKKVLLNAFSTGTLAGLVTEAARSSIGDLTGFLYADMHKLITETELAAYSKEFFGEFMDSIKTEQPSYNIEENFAKLAVITFKIGPKFVAGLTDATLGVADEFVSTKKMTETLTAFTELVGDYLEGQPKKSFDSKELGLLVAKFDDGIIKLVGAEESRAYFDAIYQDIVNIYDDDKEFIPSFKDAYYEAREDQPTNDPGDEGDSEPEVISYGLIDEYEVTPFYGVVSAEAALGLGFSQEQLAYSQVEAHRAACGFYEKLMLVKSKVDGAPAWDVVCRTNPE